ncbi:MAG: hypothetical protein SGPRY_002383 [Prymnesium sp.]
MSRNSGYRHGRGTSLGGLCFFCEEAVTSPSDPPSQKYTHTRQSCPLFRSVKASLNVRSYCSTDLKPSEANGFAAAGVIFVSRTRGNEIEFLMAREQKDQHDKLNFLGGKRKRYSQQALDVAVFRANRETGGLLNESAKLGERVIPLVYWEGDSKYAYFFIELTALPDLDIDVRCSGSNNPTVRRLEWKGLSQLRDRMWVRSEVHYYASRTVLGLDEVGVLPRLMEFFSAAAPSPTVHEPVMADDSGTELMVHVDFDVVSAILNASKLRDGRMLPASQVVEALQALPKSDVQKLQLRFRPDKLEMQLGSRAATEEEKELSTACFNLLKMIMDEAPALQTEIKQLEDKITKYTTTAHKGSDGCQDDPTAKISSLLSECKISQRPDHRSRR